MLNCVIMFRLYICVFFFLLITSCNAFEDRNILVSPNGKDSLVFEHITFFNPNRNGYFKVYIENIPNEYFCVDPIFDFPFSMYWGDSIIYVWGGVILDKKTNDKSKLQWKQDSTKEGFLKNLIDTSNWDHYYWVRSNW